MAQPKDPSGDKSAMRIDPKLVRELAQLLSDNALTEIEVADGDRRIKVKREPAAVIGFITFIASTISKVSPALTAVPTSMKGLAPGSGARKAVPTIGDLIVVPLISSAACAPTSSLPCIGGAVS